MRAVLLVSAELPWALALAGRWATAGDTVTVMLLDRAAGAVRPGAAAARDVTAAIAAGVTVSACDDALRRRGLDGAALVDGVKIVDLDEVADLVTDGADRVVWL